MKVVMVANHVILGWFGLAETKCGEYQVYRPNYIFIGGMGPVKNKMRSMDITSFLVSKKKDEGTTPTNGDTTATNYTTETTETEFYWK